MKVLRETVIENPYIPKELNGYTFPSPPQAYFLTLPVREILFGGAAGGGKSVGLLAGALQYVQVPRYSAVLFRRTLADLEQAGSLIPMSHEWLSGTDAQWNGQTYQWTFPSRATLSFAYLKNVNDHYRYKSAAFQTIGFDELTSFPEHQYRFLFGRNRKPVGMPVPCRVLSATNPGDTGHEWVMKRFQLNLPLSQRDTPGRQFVPSKLEDNPGLDRDAYELMLAELDPVTRAQMRHGDWHIRPEGNLFKRQWIEITSEVPPLVSVARGWDFAATAPRPGKDPDYTAGVKIGLDEDGFFYVLDVIRVRVTPSERDKLVRQTAIMDGQDVTIRIEQEPGSSGVDVIDKYVREVLPEFNCMGAHTTGKDKVVRAQNFSAAAGNRRVKIAEGGTWISNYLDELCAFPVVGHDDQVDASVTAHKALVSLAELESDFVMASAN